jgi:DNA relaxase NicK
MDNKEIKRRISKDMAIQGNSRGLSDAFYILSQYDEMGKDTIIPPAREEERNYENTPLDIMGVENKKYIEIGIDYLEFTIYADDQKTFEIYSKIFMDKIGELNFEGQTKLYENRYLGANGFAILTKPKNNGCKYHTRMIIPGQACKLIELDDLERFLRIREEEGIRIKCTRIDLRADGCPFSPLQVYDAIEEGKAETRTTRALLKKYEQPFETREDGKIGTEGMTLGSRKSERFLRIYNLHGFTRFELECKGDTANIYFSTLINNTANFNSMTIGLFQDFIRIDAEFWREFTKDYERAYMKLTKYQDPTEERLERYLFKQAAAPIGILYMIKGEKWIKLLAERGLEQARKNRKYYALLHAYGLIEE